MSYLLAVDAGIHTGFALYQRSGYLARYWSHNYGARARLKRGTYTLLAQLQNVRWLVVEGGGGYGKLWQKEAARRGIQICTISAEAWRKELLHPREQRTGSAAKHYADNLARQIIAWSTADRPTTLRHDTAEAILIGLWGVHHVGWLTNYPKIISPPKN